MMSDSAAITDLNYKDLMPTKAAWLVLFYSDDSDESWGLHPSWERVVEELRDLQVPSSSTASKPNYQFVLTYSKLSHSAARLWVSAALTLTWTRLRAVSSFLSPTFSPLPSCTGLPMVRSNGACLRCPCQLRLSHSRE